MQKQGSSGCCLWSAVLAGLLASVICCCSACLVLVFLSGNGNSSFDVTFSPTPTPINTCAGLLENIHQTPNRDQGIRVNRRYILDVYQVNGDQISGPETELVPENLVPLQNNLAAQKLIWDYFVYIIPAEQRLPLTEYRIFSDGSGKINGYYEISWKWQGETESQTWALEVDLADYQDLKSMNAVLVHEVGHMLTLNLDQLEIRTEPDQCQAYADETQCSRENSYLNQFFKQFWAGDTYTEWKEITAQTDPEIVKNGLDAFYQSHAQDFVRDYAATAPKEDLAESWTYFVMTPQPAGETIAEQKILFFYQFPRFVELRSQIRSRICQYYHMPE
jgi:hypothetical protein